MHIYALGYACAQAAIAVAAAAWEHSDPCARHNLPATASIQVHGAAGRRSRTPTSNLATTTVSQRREHCTQPFVQGTWQVLTKSRSWLAGGESRYRSKTTQRTHDAAAAGAWPAGWQQSTREGAARAAAAQSSSLAGCTQAPCCCGCCAQCMRAVRSVVPAGSQVMCPTALVVSPPRCC